MQTALKRFFNKSMLRRTTRNNAIGVVFLTVLGPFSTYEDFSLLGRIAYWSILLVLCGIVFETIIPMCLANQRLSRRMARWQRFVVGVLLSSLIAMWIVYGVEYVARGGVKAADIVWLFFCVAAVGSVMGFVNFMQPFAAVAIPTYDADINYERIPFFEVYPEFKGARLRWITMEDHYARVVLDTGEVSLHASMRELERLLSNYPGLRIHRSHWVANDAIQGIMRNGRTMEVHVGDGKKLPLGGTYRKQAERIFSERGL